MKVKIGHTMYDAEDTQIALFLTQVEQDQIASMAPDATIYCQYPKDADIEAVEEWMEEFKEEVKQ